MFEKPINILIFYLFHRMADEEFDSSSDEEVDAPATAASQIGSASENINNENQEKELEVESDAAEKTTESSENTEPAAEAGPSSNFEVNFKINAIK